MSSNSAVSVCELPGCDTTQKDLEQAFAEYLSEYCVVSFRMISSLRNFYIIVNKK